MEPRYRNPVLPADWSDPDVVRVGEDFYLTASSFHRTPGLPLLHSRDLVHWTLVGHALPRLHEAGAYSRPRHGSGVWAPAIRHHDGRFVIVYPDPDHGLFTVTAKDPAGPWSEPRLLRAGRGLIDPCPLWEEDGTAWLVHGWARSRSGIGNRLTLHRMSPDAGELLDEGRTVVDGDAIDGCRTLEGPKLYRRDGWYWILAPAGGVATGWQYAFRSRRIEGPYEHRVVLAQGATGVNGPHQGAWVDTPSGEDWFLHFQDRGAYGRVVHLQPMGWRADGWPVMGVDADGSGLGSPVAEWPAPRVARPGPPARPADGDDFTGAGPGPQWSWQGDPGHPDGAGPTGAGWYAMGPGGAGGRDHPLSLSCRRDELAADLRALPNVLEQRFPAEEFDACTTLRLESTADGARAGLAVLGREYAWVGLERRDGHSWLVARTTFPSGDPAGAGDREAGTVGGAAAAGASASAERDAAEPVRVPDGARVVLRLRTRAGAVCHLDARVSDGTGPVTDVADATGAAGAAGVACGPFGAVPGRWVGAAVALFAAAPGASGEGPEEENPGAGLFGPFVVEHVGK
ncbi:glycoside hydrolase family 43 protein [Allostreptomyces psammosilenae]|uniref:Beta-xylosidase C-terminal Concanavalin A-like domain-containing protein n=1 Tax=Allostreptomyces psammosilenae TaxID=1892865 RepID=A0A852ZNG4_9ACTN|nr:glycoside hydrolase 43 family protein [Allostreptomyces psammosilenae]NYI03205.1 hypothetical protein [Allostreptomyces psammosilenae]